MDGVQMSLEEWLYTSDDLNGLRVTELLCIIRRQLHKWPHRHKKTGALAKLSKSHVTKASLRRVILNPSYGFMMFSSRSPEHQTNSTPTDLSSLSTSTELNMTTTQFVVSNASVYEPGVIQMSNKFRTMTPCLLLTQVVYLFVEDECDKSSKRKFTETISLPVLDIVACQLHEFRVNPRDVLDRLKGILRKRHGVWITRTTVQCTLPDPRQDGFYHYFIDAPFNDLLTAETTIDAVTISSNALRIMVETSNDHYTYMANSSMLNFMPQAATVNDASTKPLLVARERSDLDATWLKEQISLQPGYDLWQKLRHHVISGPDIKGYWDFAVRIVEQYAHTRCPSGRKLSKERVVRDGLCFGMTWFNEIKESLALLEKYENDPEVAEWLTFDKRMLGGSKGLQRRLQIHHETIQASSTSSSL
ncbi:uncharacterized protein EV420DRAFT_1647015 [Desarmillaria tabescens]|uniref:Uncharacterized protein n=1 Tax=Armillaria tabescens TaxID=1929756 RepID=A0AA39JY95_ARMTA|nr:uncharacterized protein EV420DRAFT_1647015 [Desarmillaria tabescens]KAK0449679.1 hypothetical protein EV420DRAFT_1647015 [Desarmillaria tabescens]